jgi:hypothetical protein
MSRFNRPESNSRNGADNFANLYINFGTDNEPDLEKLVGVPLYAGKELHDLILECKDDPDALTEKIAKRLVVQIQSAKPKVKGRSW